jgi:Hemerythrin HHE cation binding domain
MVPTINAGDPPKPMPMAIMRNAHEVIRGAVKDIQAALDMGDVEEAAAIYAELAFFSNQHMLMEEGVDGGPKGLFQMMDDHADGVASKAGLRNQHPTITQLEKELEQHLITSPDMQKAKQAWTKFATENEAHLIEEERVMMPCVMGMAKGGKPVKLYMKTYFLPVITNDDATMERFLKFGNRVLERHDGIEGKPRVRVFDHAFWAVATPEQWNKWNVWIQESLSPPKYKQVMGEIKAWIDEQNSAWC